MVAYHKLCVTRVQAIGDSGVVGLNDCNPARGKWALALAGHLGQGGGEATPLGLGDLAPGSGPEVQVLVLATGLDGQRASLGADVAQLLRGQGAQGHEPVTRFGE